MPVLFFILKMLSIIVLVFACILCAVLFIPFQYSVQGTVKDKMLCRAKMCWLFGIIIFEVLKDENEKKFRPILRLLGIKIFIPVIGIKIRKNKKIRKVYKKNHKKKFDKSLFSRKFVNLIVNYIRDILKITKPKVIEAYGIYGFDDPAITGFICGIISIVKEVFPNDKINLSPQFSEEVYNINFRIKGTIFVCIIGFKTICLLLRREMRRIIFSKKEKIMKPLKE